MNPLSSLRENDRREYPRISCSLQVRTREGLLGTILDLSQGGLFVALPGHPPLTEYLEVFFTLSDEDERGRAQERPFRLVGRVRRSLPLKEGGFGLGLQFMDLGRADQEALHRFVLRHIIDDIVELVEHQSTDLKPADLLTVSALNEVEELLRGIVRDGGELSVFQRGEGNILSARLKSAENQRLVLELHQEPSHPLAGRLLHVSCRSHHYNHYFNSSVELVQGKQLELKLPMMVFSYDIRRSPRTSVANAQMVVEIPLPWPPGAMLRREVIDYSNGGLALRVPASESYFLPGTPLRELRILTGEGMPPIIRDGQVMHVTPLEECGEVHHLKIGLAFGIANKDVTHGRLPQAPQGQETSFFSRMAGFLKHLTGKALSPSKAAPRDPLASVVDVVRYPNRRREDLVGIINTTSKEEGRLHAPLVIIPPAHGKRKESTSGLALTLLENFKRRRKDLIVLRYDGLKTLGESFKDPDARVSGLEAMHWTLSQAVEDLEVTLEYAYNNARFFPTEVIILSPSLQAIPVRRFLSNKPKQKVDYWISLMGIPAAQEALINTSGGIDHIANHIKGIKAGVRHILGMTGDMDAFAADAVANSLAFIGDARRQVSSIELPITWFCGIYDAWVDPASVRQIMEGPSRFPRDLIELQVGHVPLNGTEAISCFAEVVRHLWRFLFNEEVDPVFPSVDEFKRIRQLEWARAPKKRLTDKRAYWQNYLLGSTPSSSGYDAFELSDEYGEFVRRELELLDIKPGMHVADFGCGTGCIMNMFFERFGGRKAWKLGKLTMVDLVPEALERTRRKLERTARKAGQSLPELEFRPLNLQMSALRVLKRFLDGEFYGYDPLKGVVQGLSDYSVEVWKRLADWRLHGLLRGRPVTEEDLGFLAEAVPELERQVLLDFNRLARYTRGQTLPEDLIDARRVRNHSDLRSVGLGELKFEVLKPSGQEEHLERLPFEDASFDRIISSLVLSYLDNPAETLAEYVRCLKPGGRIVFSSMMPDVDTGRIYLNVLRKVESNRNLELPEGVTREGLIEDLRAQLNSVSTLLQIADEGQFTFFSREEMRQLAERAGLPRSEVFASYGDPPRAYVAVGYKA